MYQAGQAAVTAHGAQISQQQQTFNAQRRQNDVDARRQRESDQRALSDAVNAATGNNGALSGNSGSATGASSPNAQPAPSPATTPPGGNVCGERYAPDANGYCVLKSQCEAGWHVCPVQAHEARVCCPDR